MVFYYKIPALIIYGGRDDKAKDGGSSLLNDVSLLNLEYLTWCRVITNESELYKKYGHSACFASIYETFLNFFLFFILIIFFFVKNK